MPPGGDVPAGLLESFGERGVGGAWADGEVEEQEEREDQEDLEEQEYGEDREGADNGCEEDVVMS